MIEEKPTLCYYLAGIYKPTKISLDKKTDRIETHTLLFGGTFFTTGQTVFFPEPRRENKNKNSSHAGQYDGRQRLCLSPACGQSAPVQIDDAR